MNSNKTYKALCVVANVDTSPIIKRLNEYITKLENSIDYLNNQNEENGKLYEKVKKENKKWIEWGKMMGKFPCDRCGEIAGDGNWGGIEEMRDGGLCEECEIEENTDTDSD